MIALLNKIEQVFEDYIKRYSEFLRFCITSKCYLPSHLLFDSELRRLRFSVNGHLLQMTPGRQKLIIISLFMFRVLMCKLISRPEDFVGEDIDKINNQTRGRIRIVNSLLY